MIQWNHVGNKWQFKDDDIFGNSSDKHKLMKYSNEDNNIAYYMQL